MKNAFLLLVTVFSSGYWALAFGQVTFVVTSLPANPPAGGRIFLAGTVNHWNPGDTIFRLSPTSPL